MEKSSEGNVVDCSFPKHTHLSEIRNISLLGRKGCKFVAADAWSMTIAARVEQDSQEVSTKVNSKLFEGPEMLTNKHYFLRDEKGRKPTHFSLEPWHESTSEIMTATLSAHANAHYTDGDEEQLHIANLDIGKLAIGSNAKPTGLVVLPKVLPDETGSAVLISDLCWGLHFTTFNALNIELGTTDGKRCGTFPVMFHAGTSTGESIVLDGSPFHICTQQLLTMISIPAIKGDTSSECMDILHDSYEEFLEYEFPDNGSKLFFASIELHMHCVSAYASTRKSCVFGEGRHRYAGTEWEIVDEESYDDDTLKGETEREMPISINWYAAELRNVKPEQEKEVLSIMHQLLGPYFRGIIAVLDPSVSRGALAGVRMSRAFRHIVGVATSQWKPTEKLMAIFSKKSITVLTREYMIGLVILIILFVVTAVTVLIFAVKERREPERAKVKIPISTSAWLSAALSFSGAVGINIYNCEFLLPELQQ